MESLYDLIQSGLSSQLVIILTSYFPGGSMLDDSGKVKIYPGAAATVECLATTQLDELIEFVSPSDKNSRGLSEQDDSIHPVEQARLLVNDEGRAAFHQVTQPAVDIGPEERAESIQKIAQDRNRFPLR